MLTLTESAIKAVSQFIRGSGDPAAGLRVSITGGGCSGFQYGLSLAEVPGADDVVVESGGVKVFVDPLSAPLLEGVTIDFLDGIEGTGFRFTNPNASASCGCGKSFSA